MRRFKKWIPALVSLVLVVWLIRRVSLPDLLNAATQVNWLILIPPTAAMVVGLYLWDAVCLQTLFGSKGHPVSYRQALHVRGTSYIACAVNYQLGHAMVSWGMAHLQQSSLLAALSRCVLLTYHDAIILLSLGLFGSLLSDDPLVAGLPSFCTVGILLFVGLGLVPFFLPETQRNRFKTTRWGAWLETWTWSRSTRLVLSRLVYFSILVVYGAAALWFCRIKVDTLVVVSTIPLVLMADGLPSISGLGTRETALLFLLRPERPEALLALSLFWSTGLILGRLMIGVTHLWIPQLVSGELDDADRSEGGME